MSHRSCCVVNCKNTSRKSECKFYKFPTSKWKINQRNKWVAAVYIFQAVTSNNCKTYSSNLS